MTDLSRCRSCRRPRPLSELIAGECEGGCAPVDCRTPVHDWFELSYAQYLTIPRSILEAMPVEWQLRFAACLEELDAAYDWRPAEGRYWVQLKDDRGRYADDPLREYRRPDRAYIAGLRREEG